MSVRNGVAAGAVLALFVAIGLLVASHKPATGIRVASARDDADMAERFRVAQADPTPAEGPSIVGQTDGPAVDVVHVGEVAYVGVGARVRALDVSDPAAVTEIGSSPILGGAIFDIEVADGFLLVGHELGVTALSLEEPSRPPPIGEYSMPGGAAHVLVNGAYAYLLATGRTFPIDQVIDISDPGNMRSVGEFEAPSPKNRFARASNRLYSLETGSNSLFAYDVADPSDPRLINDVYVGGEFRGEPGSGLAATDDVVFVGMHDDLLLLDAHDLRGLPTPTFSVGPSTATPTGRPPATATPTSPPPTPGLAQGTLSRISTGGPVRDIVLRESAAYAATGGAGFGGGGDLRVIDVANPRAPRTLGFAPAGDARRVDPIGDTAYVAAYGDGLQAFDVAGAGIPQRIPVPPLTEWATGTHVVMSGSYAYVASANGLEVVDLADRANPRTVGQLNVPAAHLARFGDLLVVVGQSGEAMCQISVVQTRSPDDPVLLGATEMDGTAVDVAVGPGYAYVAAGRRGVHIVDLQNRAAPVRVATVGTSWGRSNDVAVSENILVASTGLTGLHFVDVSSPSSPREIGPLPLVQFGSGLEFAGGALWTVGRPDLNPDDFFGFDPVADYLVRIDVTSPDTPAIAQVIEVGTLPTDLSIQNDTAFVTSSHGWRFTTPDPALVTINLVDGTHRSTVLPSEPLGVAVEGETAVVTTETGGLLVVALDAAPASPTPPTPPPTTHGRALLPRTYR